MVEVGKEAGASPTEAGALGCDKSGEQCQGGAQQAALFFTELLGSCESLEALAEDLGPRTVADLMYLQNAILKGDKIDVWPGETRVGAVLERLPSAKVWLGHTRLGGLWDQACECIPDEGRGQAGDGAALLTAGKAEGEREGVTCYAGYIVHDGARLEVGFEAPSDSSQTQLDAAFLAALAEQTQLDYLAVGSK